MVEQRWNLVRRKAFLGRAGMSREAEEDTHCYPPVS
jgi:hypothetical protein